ncbi:MAG: GNAT family N-acetyltransferase [Hyphomonadaceae bacterium]
MKLLHHPGAGWSVRRARSSDFSDISVIFRACLEVFPWRAGAVEEHLRLRIALVQGDILVAEEDQAGVIGFLILERKKPYVSHLFVDPDWSFCGVGAGLLEVARDVVRQPLQLDVDVLNVHAQAAYEAMGWTVVAPAGGRNGDQIRMIGP